MRAARGACWLIVIGLLSTSAVALLDAWIRFPGWARGLILASWITGVGVLTWRLIVRAWRDDPPMANPIHEARKELPGNLRAASAAALVIGACLMATAFLPGTVEQVRRIALPWHRTPATQYRIIVTSGDPVVRRGYTVTLTAYTEKTDSGAAPLTAAIMHWRDTGRTGEQSLPMIGDGNAAFHVTRLVTNDFEYRIEAGGATSEWFTVVAIDPIELVEGSVTEIVAPKYASTAARSVRPGFAAVDGIQYSTAEFLLRFNRPPTEAFLEFRAEGSISELTRLTMSADRLSGTAILRLKQDGILRLVTVVEQDGRKLRQDEAAVNVRVKQDQAPRFERIVGLTPRELTARPGEKLDVAIVVTDDLAIGEAVLEYGRGTNGAATTSVPFPLNGGGTTRASGRLTLDLTDKVREGETLRVRLRVTDSRRLDDPALKPQETVYPESGWTTVRIDPASLPIEVQEIAAKRDHVRAALERALKELREEAFPLIDRVVEDADKPMLPTDHITRLNNSRDLARSATGLLQNAQRESRLSPDLQLLTGALQLVAEGNLKDGEDALRRAALASPPNRGVILTTGRKQLADASARIEALLALNDRLARARLDTHTLTMLAAEQTALAARVATTPPEDVAALQQQLLTRFGKLLQESDPLRTAMDAARQLELNRLARDASDLARLIHELNDSSREFQAKVQEQVFAGFLADQKSLATTAELLLSQVETAARLSNATLPKAEEFHRVTELLSGGKHVDALIGMAQLAVALDSVATTFERLANDRLDSKAATRQLAHWQDDLRNRYRVATAGLPTNFAMLPAATQASFRAEQAAIRAATMALRVAPGESSREREKAVEQVSLVSNFLNGTGANVDKAMEVAAAQLNQLVKHLPPIPERLAKTRPEFDRLSREQESIAVGVEQVFRNSDPATYAKKLAPLVLRQQLQIAAFAALDLPGYDVRRLRMLIALTAAVTDLQSALTQDSAASQAWVRREFERFRSILFDNTPPPDDKTDEFARRLHDAVKGLQTTGATPAIALSVQDISRQLAKMTRTPEASALLADAIESARVADLSFRNNTKPTELIRKVQTAAEDLVRLSDRLNGMESDHDRVRRLAGNRRLAATRAREIAPNSPVNPEASRELARELEELTLTRVGFVAQLHKKRLMDEYARLRDKPGADRQAGAQANLATGLDELAALMADIDDLTDPFERGDTTTEATAADKYLPSRVYADSLRTLAARHRTARERIANLPTELKKWTTPAKTNPLEQIERQQRELSAEISRLVKTVAGQAAKLPADPYFAESESLLVANHLRTGSIREALENGERASLLLRKLGESSLAKGASDLAERQKRLLEELAKVSAFPGVIAARQRARVRELSHLAGELVTLLQAAALDTGLESEVGKRLSEGANAASTARKLLTDADDKWVGARAEEVAALCEEAEAQFRKLATLIGGTGGPSMSEQDAIGLNLRRTELAMRQSIRDLETKPDVATVTKAMRTAAEGMNKATVLIRERFANPGK